MISKKGIGPVVATALLLVVAVVSVVGFSSWMDTYSSSTFVDVETKSSSQAISIESVSGNYLYVKNSNTVNETIDSINVGGVDCSISQNISYGVTKIDIGKCFDETNSIGEQGVFLVSSSGVVEKEFNLNYVDTSTCSNVTSGLVGLWNMDNNVLDSSNNLNDGALYGNTKLLMNFDSGTANDLTEYNNDGTINGANCGVPGISGQGCSFDGLNDYIDLGDITTYDGLDKFTFSAWVYSLNHSLTQGIMTKYIGDTQRGLALFLMPGTTKSNIRMIVYNNGLGGNHGRWDSDVEVISTNSWHHISASVNLNSKNATIFVDNEPISITLTETGTGLPSVTSDVTGKFFIGAREYGGGSTFFNGTIDEVSIYSKALTSSEVGDLYTSQKAKFIEYGDSNLGSSLDLSGSEDYLLVDSTTSTNIYGTNKPLTLMSWIKFGDDVISDLIITKGIYPNYEFRFATSGSGVFDFGVNDAGSFKIIQAPGSLDTSWHLWTGVYNTTHLLLYMDGNLVNSTTHSGVVNQDTSKMVFGKYIDNDLYDFKGYLDDVALYNRSLSSTEIKKIYNRGLVGKPICNP